jgi:hypothetical protein
VLIFSGDRWGGGTAGEFPSESLLRIVMSSAPCSTFTLETRIS